MTVAVTDELPILSFDRIMKELSEILNCKIKTISRKTIPPGSRLNQIEKFMLPFDTEAWIWIAGTFKTSFGIVQIISLLSKQAKDLCFGRNVNSPAMNLLSTFFSVAAKQEFLKTRGPDAFS